METTLAANLELAPVSKLDCEMFMEMAERHFRELNPAFEPQADWKESYFPSVTENPRLFLRWIQVDGNRAGFTLFGIENHRFLPRQTGAIYELYIEPEFRRSGVGRSCALAAIRELQAHSPSKVQLEIMAGNVPAEKLWASLGFQKVSERWVLKDLKE
jgi:ribosomal protein S18 acetylase RimI-like enzyme